jgi:hypothetical protein
VRPSRLFGAVLAAPVEPVTPGRRKAIERENLGAAGLVKLIPAAVRDAGRYKLAIDALI